MAAVQGVYLALFGRPEDPLGLGYYNTATRNGSGLSGPGNFHAPTKRQSRFAGMGKVVAINSLHQNLFSGDTDVAGAASFSDFLSSGHQAGAGGRGTAAGMMRVSGVLSEDDWRADPTGEVFESVGLRDQLFASVFSPAGEAVVLGFERLHIDGRFAPESAGDFVRHLPHFFRSALVSSRLRLERAQAATQALELQNLSAAVLSSSAKTVAANRFFSATNQLFAADAMGGMHLRDEAADRLFQSAINESSHSPEIRAIAVRATEETMPAVIHVQALRRPAQEGPFGGEILVTATQVGARREGVNTGLLIALFDLTATEARVASRLGEGLTIAAIALENGVTTKTARTYVERIFAKTGCHRQADLIQLLRDVSPVFTSFPEAYGVRT